MPPIFEEDQVISNRVDPIRLPRPVISTIDTWDQNTQLDYPTAPAQYGRRLGWNIPSIAVTNESVNTVRSSVNLKTVSTSLATTAGIQADPYTTSQAFKAIPNMKQVIRTDSQVQITFFIDIIMAVANNQAEFAIFRDSQQISQVFNGSVPAANTPSSVTGSYTDMGPTMKRIHLYDLRWRVVTGTARVTGVGRRRTFQVSNLRAQ